MRLLDAAESLFGDRGIHQTSLDEIAAAAGLTKGAIYANFGSKKDLIASILQRKLGTDEPYPHSGTLTAWIGHLGETYESNVDRPEIRRFALAFVEFWLYGMRNESARTLLMRWFQTVRDANAKEVADLAGEDLPLPADQLVALVLALDIGVGIQRWLDPQAVPAEVYTAGLKAIIGREPP